MAVPLTKGLMKNKISEMSIGDYISCTITFYPNSKIGNFRELGSSTASEMPYCGFGDSQFIQNGKFYFIKADKGLLISDRIIKNSISWDMLNLHSYIQGKNLTKGIDGVNDDSSFDKDGIIRCLSGGVSWACKDGFQSNENLDFGAFPQTNEWDKYIVNSNLKGNIEKGDNNVWHYKDLGTICKNKPSLNISSDNHRVIRGLNSICDFSVIESNIESLNIGFRPVFEYKE